MLEKRTESKPGAADATPHYHGHRERLRGRFREAGAEALSDYELLELLLFRVMPRRDVKPLAKALVAKFGSFAEAIAAPPARLAEVKGRGLHHRIQGRAGGSQPVLAGRREETSGAVIMDGGARPTKFETSRSLPTANANYLTVPRRRSPSQSGDPTPSHADIQMTQQIVAVASPLGIAVHDHIIVGKEPALAAWAEMTSVVENGRVR